MPDYRVRQVVPVKCIRTYRFHAMPDYRVRQAVPVI